MNKEKLSKLNHAFWVTFNVCFGIVVLIALGSIIGQQWFGESLFDIFSN